MRSRCSHHAKQVFSVCEAGVPSACEAGIHTIREMLTKTMSRAYNLWMRAMHSIRLGCHHTAIILLRIRLAANKLNGAQVFGSQDVFATVSPPHVELAGNGQNTFSPYPGPTRVLPYFGPI